MARPPSPPAAKGRQEPTLEREVGLLGCRSLYVKIDICLKQLGEGRAAGVEMRNREGLRMSSAPSAGSRQELWIRGLRRTRGDSTVTNAVESPVVDSHGQRRGAL